MRARVEWATIRDAPRLRAQLERVRNLMRDGEWRTLAQIGDATGAPEASASARLRDLRREGLTVERKRVPKANGLHVYRVLAPAGQLRLFA